MKVTIVGGAGGVGASTAFNLVLLRAGHEIVLVDVRPEMVTSHVMDLEQVLELSPSSTVRAGDAGDLGDSDVVVVLSSTPLTVGTSRVEYLAKNARIVDEAVAGIDSSFGRSRACRDESGRPAGDAAAPADGPRPAADPRVHDQRQPPAAHRIGESARGAARATSTRGPWASTAT